MRSRVAFADFDRAASHPVDQLEAEFVGEIVADEHREAVPERALREELLDRRTLVLSARLYFHHHFSRLQLEIVAELLDQAADGFAHRRAQLRRRAVMDRDLHALVLEHERGVFGGHRPQALQRLAKSRERDAVLVHLTRGVAALRSVLSGVAAMPAETPVDFRDRATADEGDRTARSRAYRREEMPETGAAPPRPPPFGRF